MAISPPSDIVLDVVNAVGPAGSAKAGERLAAIARSAKAGSVANDFKPDGPSVANMATTQNISHTRASDPRVKFEGFVLQTFIETILPKDSENTFGSGLAGDMWKSMLSEKIAGVVASRGGVGIANRILADFVMNGEVKEPVIGAVDVGQVVENAHPADHSTAVLHDRQRKFISLLSGWHVTTNAEDGQS